MWLVVCNEKWYEEFANELRCIVSRGNLIANCRIMYPVLICPMRNKKIPAVFEETCYRIIKYVYYSILYFINKNLSTIQKTYKLEYRSELLKKKFDRLNKTFLLQFIRQIFCNNRPKFFVSSKVIVPEICLSCSIARNKEENGKKHDRREGRDTFLRMIERKPRRGCVFLRLNAKTNTVAVPISSVFLTQNITSFGAKRSGIALEEEWRPSNKVWLCLPRANGRRIDHRLPRNPTHYCGSCTFYTSTRRGTLAIVVSRKQ